MDRDRDLSTSLLVRRAKVVMAVMSSTLRLFPLAEMTRANRPPKPRVKSHKTSRTLLIKCHDWERLPDRTWRCKLCMGTCASSVVDDDLDVVGCPGRAKAVRKAAAAAGCGFWPFGIAWMYDMTWSAVGYLLVAVIYGLIMCCADCCMH